jgi:tripartite-type tricarboxylate transporter receptor subunit TctC
MSQRITFSRRAALGSLLVTAAATGPLRAIAQPRTLRIVTPNSAGSGVDTITRTAAPALARELATSVVVENQPGAGGVIGLKTLSRAAPDGNTLSVVSSNVAILPSVMKSLPFDISGDFTPIALVCVAPLVLVVNPSRVPASNAREFFALLKSKPNDFTYASGGNGTVPHLAVEMVMDAAGTKARHIPYKGLGQAMNDLLGGQVDFMCAALVAVQSHIKTGALRPIGLLSAQRAPAAPDLATLQEQGLSNFTEEAWIAVIGPKGMDPATVKRTHEAVAAAFKDPAVVEAMTKQGNVVRISTPAEAAAVLRRDLQKYAALAKKVGLEPQ